MKHNLSIVFWLVGLFLVAQYIGLFVVNQYIDYGTSEITGNFTVTNLPAIAGQEVARPQIEERESPFYLMGAILIGTLILLFIIRWGKALVWKAWFFLAVVLCLHFAAYAFLKSYSYGEWLSLGIALVLGAWKVWKPNTLVHNLTELFLYGGLAAIFFSVVNIEAMAIILVLISLYDIYAVWKSGHMVELARFQAKSGIFAGLMLPSAGATGKLSVGSQGKRVRAAILGGGDIGFPLLFAASVLKEYAIAGQGWLALLIPPFAALALLALFLWSKKDKMYPAMPFLSLGCFAGLLVVWLL